jgi:hypothetical protein
VAGHGPEKSADAVFTLSSMPAKCPEGTYDVPRRSDGAIHIAAIDERWSFGSS